VPVWSAKPLPPMPHNVVVQRVDGFTMLHNPSISPSPQDTSKFEIQNSKFQ
jgi:hypothetical protein